MGILDKLQFADKSELELVPEIGPEFEQDPEPGERPRRRKASPKADSAPAMPTKAATTKMAKEVAEDLASLIEMGAAVWGMSDECCAPTLEQQAKPIADALTGILARNPRLLAKFADTDMVAYSIQAGLLFKALKPVAVKVYANHVSRTAEGGHGDGVHLGAFPAYSGNGAGIYPRTVTA